MTAALLACSCPLGVVEGLLRCGCCTQGAARRAQCSAVLSLHWCLVYIECPLFRTHAPSHLQAGQEAKGGVRPATGRERAATAPAGSAAGRRRRRARPGRDGRHGPAGRSRRWWRHGAGQPRGGHAGTRQWAGAAPRYRHRRQVHGRSAVACLRVLAIWSVIVPAAGVSANHPHLQPPYCPSCASPVDRPGQAQPPPDPSPLSSVRLGPSGGFGSGGAYGYDTPANQPVPVRQMHTSGSGAGRRHLSGGLGMGPPTLGLPGGGLSGRQSVQNDKRASLGLMYQQQPGWGRELLGRGVCGWRVPRIGIACGGAAAGSLLTKQTPAMLPPFPAASASL